MAEDGPERVGEKVAIVTAAGSGMGAACARELASRGYAVALISSSGKAEDLAKELGGLGLTGSVTEVADLESLVGETLDRYGRIDRVINSTGHPASGEILGLTDEQWHEALDLVLLNVVRMARLVTPAMRRQGAAPSSTSPHSPPSSRRQSSPSLPPCAPPWPASPSSTQTVTLPKASG
jgi:NAD(P)-dependent dehydrogenase (short-subunit alcohol dehydrogenase family)